MKRGDIVTIADRIGDFTGKPRPALVVQADAFNAEHATVTVCLITSEVTGHALFRVPLPQGAETGMRVDSEIAVDKLQTIRRHKVGRCIGAVSTDTIFAVDQALRRWLAL
jgi:mRNA interferase MazF